MQELLFDDVVDQEDIDTPVFIKITYTKQSLKLTNGVTGYQILSEKQSAAENERSI